MRSLSMVLVLVVAVVLAACGGGEGEGTGGSPAAEGEQLFATNCAMCHGTGATGTGSGPPLVHEVYEPSHHSDDTFRSAVANGVQPHHWDFGPMPQIRGVDAQEVGLIIDYIRGLQREAGIQ